MKQQNVKISDGRIALLDSHVIHQPDDAHGQIVGFYFDDTTSKWILEVEALTVNRRTASWASTCERRLWPAEDCISLETWRQTL